MCPLYTRQLVIVTDEFLPESYGEIQDVKVKIEDKTRLFIALGSKDGYNPGKLLDLLNKKAKTPGRKVKDIKIMDKYSFITVPLQEAEFIMRALNSKKDSKHRKIGRASCRERV